jgi:hypothetical protein
MGRMGGMGGMGTMGRLVGENLMGHTIPIIPIIPIISTGRRAPMCPHPETACSSSVDPAGDSDPPCLLFVRWQVAVRPRFSFPTPPIRKRLRYRAMHCDIIEGHISRQGCHLRVYVSGAMTEVLAFTIRIPSVITQYVPASGVVFACGGNAAWLKLPLWPSRLYVNVRRGHV